MSETPSAERASQPDQATSLSGRFRWPSRMLASASLAVTGGIAAVAVAATLLAPDPSRSDPSSPEAVLFKAPEPAAAQRLPDAEPSPAAAAVPPVRARPALDASVLLRLPGPVPSSGTGSFGYASRPGLVLGTAGPLRRYRVAVEGGSGVDAEAFAAAVDEALGDERSWTGGGRLRLQRVPARARHDFTILLASANTAGRLCAGGGVNIRVGGRPYTSCRVTGKVILNLDRWQLSVDHLVAARVPLALYRAYVVNHEVGHELGYRHEGCPRRGAPAPVMMQQTLFLDGCRPNPWPYVDGARYAGPRR
ncbi:MAG TPA: DUF3152 domain-containing protein [Micromonosporaceae bacterium]|nr:DUF3152 domain-containing protein [Micromonosporaceae bacterium]